MKTNVVVGLGAASWDTTTVVDRFPSYEDLPSIVESETEQIGGPTSNVLSILSEFNMECILLCHIGNDYEGNQILNSAKKKGINTSHIVKRPHELSRRVTCIVRREDGERCFLYRPGANVEPDWSIATLVKMSHAGAAVFDEASSSACRLARMINLNGGLSVANLGWPTDGLDSLIDECSLVVMSWSFAKNWLNSESPREAVELFLSTNKTFVITNGSRGAWMSFSSQVFHVPPVALTTPLVDTTGAGDAFVAGMIHGILGGVDRLTAAHQGAKLASVSCGIMGGSGPLGKVEFR